GGGAAGVGGIRVVVAAGVTGVVGPTGEGFETGRARARDSVRADPATAARMGAAGRERAVREFGWDAVARRTVRLYEEVLKPG
ncbi:glycosyltransferase, partial [Streptomyces brasiliscabiei]|uniref:glycosyltransferase n=1 Tax=Streptomyces brasiliscabiei TaxID=2736302 RepID=UPI0038F65F6C